MKAIDIRHSEMGSVTSRVDGGVAFRVITPELTLDQRATLLGLHGKNVRCMLEPIDVPVSGLDVVETEIDSGKNEIDMSPMMRAEGNAIGRGAIDAICRKIVQANPLVSKRP